LQANEQNLFLARSKKLENCRACKVVNVRTFTSAEISLFKIGVCVLLYVAVTFVVKKNKDSHNLIAQDDMHVKP